MKGKKIFERIVVSVLILALTLSNVSVAAEQDQAVEPGDVQEIVQQETESPEAENTNSEENADKEGSGQETEVPDASASEDTGVGEEELVPEPGDDVLTEAPDPEAPDPDNSGDETVTPDAGVQTPDIPTSEDTDTSEPDGDTSVGTPVLDVPAADESDPEAPAQDTPAADSEAPDDAVITEETADPAIPEETAEEEVPLEKPEEEEEEPLDLDGMYTLEELTGLPDETAESTIWMTDGEEAAVYARPRRAAARSGAQNQSWGFDIYYVNQDDQYDVTQKSNFNLKYQMQFRANETLAKGAVQIKIESELLKDRDGRAVTPQDIGLPYGTPEDPSTSARTIFNYYTVKEPVETLDAEGNLVTEEKEYLVFFNCRTIPAGANNAWQVLYKDLKLMDLVDESEWTLTPQLYVDTEAGKIPDGEEEAKPAETYEAVMGMGEDGFQPGTSLTGRIDSSVSVTSVIKEPYYQSGANYTPGLYTVAQLERYIKGALPEDSDYRDEKNPTRLNTTDYRFVVWDVKVKGEATQPWNLYIEDHPTVEGEMDGSGGIEMLSDGEGRMSRGLGSGGMIGGGSLTPVEPSEPTEGVIVGYLDNADRPAGYGLSIKEPDPEDTTGASSEYQREESWGSRFYVVTAYPVEDGNIPAGTNLKNDIKIILEPVDGKDGKAELSARTASWNYKEYDWAYEGNIIGIKKTVDDPDTRYTGWLDAYQSARNQGEDYGDLSFHTTGTMNGYVLTHETDGDRIGEYREGTYYTLTTADDFLYAYWQNKDGKEADALMGGEDYYFSSVTVHQEDYGYDIWEDRLDDSELKAVDPSMLPANLRDTDGNPRSEVRIWAKFADGENQWEPVDTVLMDSSGKLTYEFTNEQISRKPYRVMVEHDSIDYRTVCNIDVTVRMRAGSPVMKAVMDARDGAGSDTVSPEIRFENLAGAIGASYDGENVKYYSHNTQADDTEGTQTEAKENLEFDYSKYNGLESAAAAEYPDNGGRLMIRDNAYRKATWLTRTAKAFKTGSSRNDVNNSRVLVDYMLTAYDGYEIYDRSCLDYLSEKGQNLISPHRNYVVFYDLLPYGMTYDASQPVRAGIIRSLDRDGKYQKNPDLWDESQVSATVLPEEIITDYRGTGRTLVTFRLEFTGADATSYTDGKWIEGWGVSFRAYYDWKEGDIINAKEEINANLCAFMPDFSDRADGSNDTHPELLGLKGEVYPDDGTTPDNRIYGDLVKPYNEKAGELDGIDRYNEVPHILYAKHPLSDDVAVNARSQIEKLVRSDADRLGAFTESTVVPMDGNEAGLYTYQLSVTATEKMTGIVLYDHLENAAEELKDAANEPFVFNDNPWHGTFRSLDLSGLELMGITPAVYYSDKRDARIPTGSEEPSAVFEADGSEWMKAEDFQKKYGEKWAEAVGSVAVDLGSYVLEPNHSVSVQIRMQAPEVKEGEGYYTYNHAAYSSQLVGHSGWATLNSRSVRTARSMPQILEVAKKFSGDVPASVQNTVFEFRVYEEYEYNEGSGAELRKQPLAYTEYELLKEGGSEDAPVQATATDGDGYLYLHAGETAVFHVADAARITVEETRSVFWDSVQQEEFSREDEEGNRVPDEDGEIRTVTVTNTYRPVLYLEKRLAGVPDSLDPEMLDQYEFEFRLMTMGNTGRYDVPAADAEYWVVDSPRLDGGMPQMLRTGRTGADGTFKIRQGEIIALFPGPQGTGYQLEETTPGEDWICQEPVQTGTLSAAGDSRSFTNYYKWKDLYLTKEIIGQTQDEYEGMESYEYEGKEVDPKLFTFQLSKVVKAEKEPDAQSGKAARAVSGRLASARNTADAEPTRLEAVPGLKWVLLTPKGEPAGPEGTLDSEGRFTWALGYGRVRISGLEAGVNYVITEIKDEIAQDPLVKEPLYVPVSDTAEVLMPVFSSSKDAKIVNEYRRSDLLVTKTVVTGASAPAAEEDGTEKSDERYTFLLTIDGAARGNYPYTVTCPGREPDSGQTKEDGTFTLAGGETACFRDAGMRGHSFKVYERAEENAEYKQIYPSGTEADKEGYGAPYEGTFTGEQSEASFVNGEAGNLYISKEYTAVGDQAEQYLADLAEMIGSKHAKWQTPEEAGFVSAEDDGYSWDWGLYMDRPGSEFKMVIDGFVMMTLDIADPEGNDIWPEDGLKVRALNYLNGEQREFIWEKGSAAMVHPWTVIIVPTGGNGLGPDAVYTLRELKQHQIVRTYAKLTFNSYDGLEEESVPCFLQVSQSYPANDEALTGKVAEKPNAAIYNEVSDIEVKEDSSMIYKDVVGGLQCLDGIPEGSRLVWRLERYEAGTWAPAEGIPYVISLRGNKTQGGGIIHHPVSDEICKTGEDGEILIEKKNMWWGYPEVQFTENKVYLNLYDDEKAKELLAKQEEKESPLLRLVEVPEKSDSAWGLLVGYGGQLDTGYYQGVDMAPEYAETFINSNRMTTIRLRKTMSQGANAPDESFTMILEQVLSAEGISEMGEVKPENVKNICSEPRSGLAYTVYDADGNPRTERTGAGGEIRLRAGEYADVRVPWQTTWTLREDLSAVPNYTLSSLTPDPGNSCMTKLDENLMLIRTGRETERYKVVWIDSSNGMDTGIELDHVWRTGYVGDMVSVTEKDQMIATEHNISLSEYQLAGRVPGTVLTGSGGVVLEIRLTKKKYSIHYNFSPGAGFSSIGIVDRTTYPKGAMARIKSSKPKRNGYVFLGWSTDPDRDPNGTLYQPDGEFEVTDDVIGTTDGVEMIQLYDVWKEESTSVGTDPDADSAYPSASRQAE